MRTVLGLVGAVALAVLLAAPAGGVAASSPTIPTNVDVSQRQGNESEEAIAVNPTNPDNIVIVTNIAEGFSGLFKAVSFDGGATAGRDHRGRAQAEP